MKRINSTTGNPYKRGECREDGKRFWRYESTKSSSGFYYESWVTEDRFVVLQKEHCEKRFETPDTKAKSSERFKRYYAKNKTQIKSNVMKRWAALLERTPKWLTNNHIIEITEFYAEATRLTEKSGILHHVDHIVPLQGKKVSGLHVPWNLQILTATENLSKRNKFVV